MRRFIYLSLFCILLILLYKLLPQFSLSSEVVPEKEEVEEPGEKHYK